MGKVLDVYWHFSEPGDHYLGRILAGMDPSSHSFGCLPPHFNRIDPLQDPDIQSAMDMIFGPVMTAYEGKDDNPVPECDPAVCVLPACYCSADGTQAPGVTEDGSGLDIKQVKDKKCLK